MWIITKLLAASLLVLSTFVPLQPAHAQFNTGGGGGGGGGATVSLTPGCGATAAPNPITNTGIFGTNIPVTTIVNSTPYTVQASDACGLLILGIGASVLTLPATTAPGFGAGTYWRINNQSGGTITINVTAPSNLDNSSSVTVVDATAMAFQSDGSNYHFVVRSAPGIGTVTSLTGSCGVQASPSPITNSGVLQGNVPPLRVTAANPPIQASYCGSVVYLDGGTDLLPTIAQAGSAGFPIGWNVAVCSINAAQTLATTGGTIGGLGSYVIGAGTAINPVCISVISDGSSDYKLVAGSTGTVTQVFAGCGNTINGGPITTTGAVYATRISLIHNTGDTISGSECGQLATYGSGSAVAIGLPQAGSVGFPSGWYQDHVNYGAGIVTFTAAVGHFLTAGSPTTFALSQGQSVTFTASTAQPGNWEVSGVGLAASGTAVTGVSNADGTLTISPTSGAVVASLALGHANTWTGGQTFTNSLMKLLGSSTGATTLTSANASASNFTATMPANTGTVAELNLAQSWTAAQTFNNSTIKVLGSSTGATTLASANAGASNFTVTVPAATDTLALLGTAQTFTAQQTFGPVLGTVSTQSGTTYTFATTDCGTDVRFTNAGAITATIPTTLPVGCHINVIQRAAGKVSVNGTAVSACTLTSADSYTGTNGVLGSVIGIIMDAANTCILTGRGS